MPTEFSRTTAKKKIILPGGDEIYVPVITAISFIDASDRHQETQHSIDNSAQSARTVHVDKVYAILVNRDGVPVLDEDGKIQRISDNSIDVERIDLWPNIDNVDRGQETQLTIDNVTGGESSDPDTGDPKLPSFTTHLQKHIYRYYEDPEDPDDDGVWVDSELIDEFAFIDASDRHQETRYLLNNPTNQEFRDGDLSGQANESDVDISDSLNGIDPPYRLDPFQNIVNFSAVFLEFIEVQYYVPFDYQNIQGQQRPHVPGTPIYPPDFPTMPYWRSSATWGPSSPSFILSGCAGYMSNGSRGSGDLVAFPPISISASSNASEWKYVWGANNCNYDGLPVHSANGTLIPGYVIGTSASWTYICNEFTGGPLFYYPSYGGDYDYEYAQYDPNSSVNFPGGASIDISGMTITVIDPNDNTKGRIYRAYAVSGGAEAFGALFKRTGQTVVLE